MDVLCIIGHPRSGTTYTTRCLQRLGRRIDHESMGEDGTCGGNALWLRAAAGAQKRYILQVRQPEKVIASLPCIGQRLVLKWARRLDGWRQYQTACRTVQHAASWVLHTRLALEHAEWHYRVEDLGVDRRVTGRVLEAAGLPGDLRWPTISRQTNSRRHGPADLSVLPQELVDGIAELKEVLGYES